MSNKRVFVSKLLFGCLIRLRMLQYLFSIMNAGMAGPAAQEKDKMINQIQKKKLKVLIVDDDDELRESMTFHLNMTYSVQVADVESGLEAIENLKNGNHYDQIFLDIMMPGMTGVEVFHEFQKMGVDIPIAIMSAYSNSDEWKKAEDLGIPLLHKPISEESLLEILSKC
jgi:CheY-like chemotaxis protein